MRLDGGPARINRLEQPRQPARPQKAPSRADEGIDNFVADDRPANRESRSRAPQPRARAPRAGWLKYLIGSIVVIAIVAIGYFWLNGGQGVSQVIDQRKNQAVFMVNGQVYFGKLKPVDDQYLKLSEVFYIQSSQEDKDTETKASPDASLQLIKLGEEVHGPEDHMIINRSQVLFIEDLKPGGKVAELIEKYRQGSK